MSDKEVYVLRKAYSNEDGDTVQTIEGIYVSEKEAWAIANRNNDKRTQFDEVWVTWYVQPALLHEERLIL